MTLRKVGVLWGVLGSAVALLVLILLARSWHAQGPAIEGRPGPSVSGAVTQEATGRPEAVMPQASAAKSSRPTPAAVDPRSAFRKVCLLHATTVTDIAHSNLGRFATEELLHLREARLLARAYPQECMAMAGEVARDPSRTGSERELACFLLSVLAAQHQKEAENQLLALAQNSKDSLSVAALHYLIEADFEGAHRDLYLTKSREGSFASISALEGISRWMDGVAVEVMKGIVATNSDATFPESEFKGRAEENLQKAEILMGGNAETALLEILQNRESPHRQWTLWSLYVARARQLPGLLPALRQRLDGSEAKAKSLEQKTESFITGLGRTDPGGFEFQFVASAKVDGMPDQHFDELLVAYSELGGALTDLEKGRLRTFGYLGDAKDKLQELMPE
jgi:hypothetical protein